MLKRSFRRRRAVRRGSRPLGRIRRRVITRRRRVASRTRRYRKRSSRLNQHITVKASWTDYGTQNVAMQSGNVDKLVPYMLVTNMNAMFGGAGAGLLTAMWSKYQRFCIRRLTARFVPNKLPMHAQQVNLATSLPLNPPLIDNYITYVREYTNFIPPTKMTMARELPGCRSVNGAKPFSVSFRPRVEKVATVSGTNIFSGSRSMTLPTTSDASLVNHFGRCVSLRQPYDVNVPAGIDVSVFSYDVYYEAVVSFYDAKAT